MHGLPQVVSAAQARLATKKAQQDDTHRRVSEKTLRYLDPSWMSRRMHRLLLNPIIERALVDKGVAEELREAFSLESLSEAAHGELERVIEGADFMPSWFLSRGAELRRTVARVRARTASGKEKKGTGFLVGPRLLLTNAHVLDWSDIGEECLMDTIPYSVVEFDYEEQFNGAMAPVSTFRLDAATLCLYSPWDALDYVLIALGDRSHEGVSVGQFGFNLLAGDVGKIAKGEPVFIIQHPNGQPKQVVLQNNRLIDRDEDVPYLTYEADTDIGSSGSPVFNRQWEVVALHHAPQIDRDHSGRMLARNGDIWTPAMGSANVMYLGLNEGVRVSRLMADWARKEEWLRQGASSRLLAMERCSPEGLALLSVALTARKGAPPSALVVPVPAERRMSLQAPLPFSGHGSFRFPRPD